MARILLIDDNPQDRRLARRALEQEFSAPAIVEVADESTLGEALALAPFDAVVTDFRLRWQNGLEVLARIKTEFPDVPVLMFTDSGSEEVAAEGFRAGLSDYILKGAGQYARLAHGVRRAIERAGAERNERTLLAREHEARLLAEQANRMKDEFLATLSHELRTPLNAIAGWLQIVQRERGNADEVTRAAERIDRNVRVLGRLIDDLTDVSRITSGKLSIRPAPVDLNDVVRAALDSVQAAAAAKRLRVSVDLGAEHPIVRGDADRLQQVAWNLLSNAVKFTPPGGEIHVSIERDDQQLRLIVSDNGQGIKPEFLHRVFDRFSQQDTGMTRPHSGLGLGLALVRHLVELHGGTVAATSAGENEGATFIVTLPAVPAEAPVS